LLKALKNARFKHSSKEKSVLVFINSAAAPIKSTEAFASFFIWLSVKKKL